MMKLFRRKKEEISSLYKIGDEVNLIFQNDRKSGIVYKVYKDKDGNVKYDINIMGQCPYIIKNIAEKDLKLKI